MIGWIGSDSLNVTYLCGFRIETSTKNAKKNEFNGTESMNFEAPWPFE